MEREASAKSYNQHFLRTLAYLYKLSVHQLL
jgi:hypothetical protein